MKGQITSFDFMVASTVFIVLFFSGMTLWNQYSTQLDRSYWSNELRFKAYLASESLMRSTGSPFNWSSTGRAGLDGLNGLDELKVKRLVRLAQDDYENSKTLLGLEEFDYRLIVSGEEVSYDTGKAYAGATELVSIKRFAPLDKKAVTLKLLVWRSS